MEQKTFIKASCNNIHTGEKVFAGASFEGFRVVFFSGRVAKPVVYLICMTLLWISRGCKTKLISFMRSKLVFLYVDN